MDYELAALKVFCCELRVARQEEGKEALSLFGIRFQRAWLQGVLVASKGNGRLFLLDDGTDLVELTVPPSLAPSSWKPGMYVMAVGPCQSGALVAHKMVDLSSHPHREAMWHLEVLEAHNMFYLKSNTNPDF